MQKKQILFAGIVVCLCVAGWGYYQYQKPRAGAAQAKAAYQVTAEQLYQAYSPAEAMADKKYNGNAVAVRGVVADVQTTAHATNVLLRAGAETGGVNCSLQQPEAHVAVGRRITVKGRCTGFLMDVSLVDAVVISE